MNKILIIILFACIFLGTGNISASCDNVVAGSSCNVSLEELDMNKDIYYTESGNSSNLKGLNVTLDEENQLAILDFAINYKSDSFTLIFFNEKVKTEVEHHYSEGDTEIKYKNNTINNTEIVEYPVPYCNDSCCDEGGICEDKDDKEPKDDQDSGKEIIIKKVQEYWQEIILSFALLVLAFLYHKNIKKLKNHSQNKKSTIGSNNDKSERRYK